MRSQTTDVPAIAILLLAILPAFAGPAVATYERPSDSEPLRFHVESVAVEGVRRASPAVIISESLLAAGASYTEVELRQAMYRVNRLPFVLEAGFSLAKGSERGKYSLLITVEEVRGFFFGSELVYATYGDALAEVSPLEDELTDTLSAGMRVFAGQGVFFAAVGDSENLQVGYERYRLLDRPVLLRFAYARQGCCPAALQELGLDPGAAVWTATDASDRLELTVGLPLGGNHSLRLDASQLETGSAVRRQLEGRGVAFGRDAVDVRDVEQRELELAWVFDSTDDPVFPSRGDALTAAVGLRWLDGDLAEPRSAEPGAGALDSTVPLSTAEMSSRLVGLSFFGARHWPLSARQTVSLSLKLLLSRSEVDNIPLAPVPGDPGQDARLELGSGDVDTLEAGFGARYSLGLWGPGKIRRLGELRWESVAELVYVDSSPVFNLAADPLWGMRLSTGIALRNSWGIFRIGFTYLDFDGEL